MKNNISWFLVLILYQGCGRQKAGEAKPTPKVSDSSLPASSTLISRSLSEVAPVGFTKFSDSTNGSGFCSVVFFSDGVAIVAEHCIQSDSKGQDFYALDSEKKAHLLRNPCKVSSKIESSSEIFQAFYFSELKTSKGLIDLSGIKPAGMFGWAETLKLESISENFSAKSTNCLPTDSKSKNFYEYSCDTIGGMSGALLRDAQGRPSAIHIGLKNGTAFGIALSAIQNQMPNAQKLQLECGL